MDQRLSTCSEDSSKTGRGVRITFYYRKCSRIVVLPVYSSQILQLLGKLSYSYLANSALATGAGFVGIVG